MCGYHSSVFFFIKFHAKFIEPFDCIRSFHDKSFYKLWLCSKMSAAKTIQIMLYRRIIFFICCLDSSFRHHCIGITNTKFCNDHDICTCIVGFNGTGRASSATANDKYINIIIYFCKIYRFTHQTTCRMKHCCQLKWSFLTFIGPHFDLCKRIWVIIRMELFQESIFFIRCQTSRLCCHTFCSCSFYLFDRFHHVFWVWCIHVSRPPISQSLCCCKVPAFP